MEPHEYRAAVKVFTETINSFVFNWQIKFKPDTDELIAMSEVFEAVSKELKEKATEKKS